MPIYGREQPGNTLVLLMLQLTGSNLIILMLHLLMVLKTTGMPTPSAV